MLPREVYEEFGSMVLIISVWGEAGGGGDERETKEMLTLNSRPWTPREQVGLADELENIE